MTLIIYLQKRLTEVTVANCPNVTTFVKNYCVSDYGKEIPVPTFIGVRVEVSIWQML